MWSIKFIMRQFALFGELFDYHACVVSSETERVAQRRAYLAFLRLVEREVQVVVDFFVVIAVGMVDCGRHDVFLHCF